MRHLLLTFVSLCSLAAGGCVNAGAPWVELKGRRFAVEIADTDESRARGLMFRDNLDDDKGMLFVFEREEPLSFWMRNTKIPLDILYFDSGLHLVSVSAGTPPCATAQCPSYPSAAPALYVLEINAGLSRELKVAPGDPLRLDPQLLARYRPKDVD